MPRGSDNVAAIDLIVQHLRDILKEKKNGVFDPNDHSRNSLKRHQREFEEINN